MDAKPMRDEAENVAASWLLKREGGAWSDADQAGLDEWLDASAHHRVAFIRLQALWSGADRLKSVSAGLPKGAVPARGVIEQSPFFTLRRAESAASAAAGATRKTSHARVYAVAAAVVLAVVAAWGVRDVDLSSGASTYKTAIGGLSTVPTADGSVITLNTDSEIQVHLTDRERRIDLKRGEAFFDIAKDPARPFVVHANGRRVVVLGTKFSVRLESELVRVLVTEGKVRVDDPGAEPTPALTAGAVADIGKDRVKVTQQPLPQLEQTLSWRGGFIVLDETPLTEAVAEFNRYNMRQLVIDDVALRAIRVGGNFRSNNIDGFLRLLEQGFKVEAAAAPGGRIVLSRR